MQNVDQAGVKPMRYYQIKIPGQTEPDFVTNARRIRNLPEDARVFWIVTDRDGSLVEERELPVENGRVVFEGRNVRSPKLTRH